MKPTLFYSWQSDAPDEVCRGFIEAALNKAIDEQKGESLTLAAPIRLEKDTTGESGTPDIPSTLLTRIRDAAVFVGDLTLVGTAGQKGKKKKTPNPNVLVEYGYAAASMGWDRIIAVMNEAPPFGKFERQIFHLRHRRKPMCYSYNLSETAFSSVHEAEGELSRRLSMAIKACLSASHLRADKLLARLDAKTAELMRLAGKAPFFALGAHEAAFQTEIIRLLDLELLRYDHSAEAQKYAYHWTYYGDIVLKKLGIRSQTPKA